MTRFVATLGICGCLSAPEPSSQTEPPETCTATWYRDADRDGFGAEGEAQVACVAPAGFVAAGGDCDDSAADVNPAASEVCDPADRDEDCDGLAEDDDPSASGQSTWWVDGDGDGVGGDEALRCDEVGGFVRLSGDCDDGDSTRSPLTKETCGNGVDDDCSGDASGCTLGGDVYGDAAPWSVLGLEIGEFTGHALAGCGDLDGDGRDDLLIGTSEANLGAAGFVSLVSYTAGGAVPRDAGDGRIFGAAGTHLGQQIECLPDVSFDGVPDLLVAGESDAWVFANVAEVQQDGDALFHFTGEPVYVATPVGDVTGDGVPDLAIAHPFAEASEVGAAWVFPATAIGDASADDAHVTVVGASPYEHLGNNVGAPIDFDGDGVNDFVTYSHGAATQSLSLFFGPIAGLLTSASSDGGLVAEGTEQVGWSAANAGDSDGDGRDDMIVGSNSGDHAWLFVEPFAAGASASATAAATIDLDGGNASNAAFGRVGDLDADGREEFVVTSPHADGAFSRQGYAAVFYTHATGTVDARSAAELRLWGPGLEDEYGRFGARGVGDLDGDGWLDLAVSGLPGSAGASAGRVDVFFPTWP